MTNCELFLEEWPSEAIVMRDEIYQIGPGQCTVFAVVPSKHLFVPQCSLLRSLLASDPGALGKAYHYFYSKCLKPFGRYKLTFIDKFGWLGRFDYDLTDTTLSVIREEGEITILDVTDFVECPDG